METEDFEQIWEIQETAAFCLERGFKRVALQFPDSLLDDSPKIAERLQVATLQLSEATVDGLSETGQASACKFYLLADTSYNPSCVDEVAAAHINAEAIVHYGQACMCPLSRLPARYVFGRRALDTAVVAEALAEVLLSTAGPASSPKQVVIFLEHALAHHSDILHQKVSEIIAEKKPEKVTLPYMEFAALSGCDAEPLGDKVVSGASGCCSDKAEELSTKHIAGFRWQIPAEMDSGDVMAIWVGDSEAGAKAHLEMTLNSLSWASINVNEAGHMEEVCHGLPVKITRLLGRRYFLMEKARDASIVGLLVGTLGVAGYKHAICELRGLIEAAGKACYIFLVGKPSPAKLANFPEIEVFVQIGCPQGLVLDSKEFYSPVVTPHEAFVAFTGKDWDASKYRLDFQDLLQPDVHIGETSVSGEPRLSFMSGGTSLLPASGAGDSSSGHAENDTSGTALTVSDTDNRSVVEMKTSGALQVTSAAEYMTYRRTYKGLETPATGAEAKPVELAVPGLSGRAAGYQTEPNQD